jgi:GDP-4-dehydro-6-deoxy-D-mannose reductase
LPRLLVTGHAGFVGSTLRAEHTRAATGAGWDLVTLDPGADITSPALAPAIAAARPDAVIHLAALTSVADSFADADRYFAVNFGGTLNLLRALRASGFAGRLVFVGSGDCYGRVAPEELPIREDRPLRPRSPYSVSKVAAEALCYQWSQTEGLDVVLARSFNHFGPGQDARFVVADFARQIARIRTGLQAPRIVVGNVDVTRDFTDVRDVVAAYFALLRAGKSGEAYNVGSGVERTVRSLLDTMIARAGVAVSVEVDAARLRSGEQDRVVADISRIRAETGWSPRLDFARSLGDTLDYWIERTRRE